MSKNEKIFRVAWDGDGVLIDSDKSVLSVVNKELSQILGKKINLTSEDLTDWNALTTHVLNLTGDSATAKRLTAFWFDPDTLRLSPPNPAAIEVFRRCLKLPDTEQFVITTRTPVCAAITQNWLEEFLPEVDWSTKFHIRSNTDISGDDFKVSKLSELDINHMLEDSSATITRLISNASFCQFSYVSQPWNSSDIDSTRLIIRVSPHDPEAMFQHILKTREKFLKSDL
jgi:hypothetical protein